MYIVFASRNWHLTAKDDFVMELYEMDISNVLFHRKKPLHLHQLSKEQHGKDSMKRQDKEPVIGKRYEEDITDKNQDRSSQRLPQRSQYYQRPSIKPYPKHEQLNLLNKRRLLRQPRLKIQQIRLLLPQRRHIRTVPLVIKPAKHRLHIPDQKQQRAADKTERSRQRIPQRAREDGVCLRVADGVAGEGDCALVVLMLRVVGGEEGLGGEVADVDAGDHLERFCGHGFAPDCGEEAGGDAGDEVVLWLC